MGCTACKEETPPEANLNQRVIKQNLKTLTKRPESPASSFADVRGTPGKLPTGTDMANDDDGLPRV